MSPREWKKLFMRGVFYALFAALLTLLLLLSLASWRVFSKDWDVKEGYERAQENLEHLETRKTELEADLENLSLDRGIETEVREKYALAREGEEVIIIVDRDAAKSDESSAAPQSFWERIKAWFAF